MSLYESIKNKNIQQVKDILSSNESADLSFRYDGNYTLFEVAARTGNYEIIKLLIESGDLAIYFKGTDDIFESLYHIKDNCENQQYLEICNLILNRAVFVENLTLTKHLVTIQNIKMMSDDVFDGFSPLEYAASKGNAELVKVLLTLNYNFGDDPDNIIQPSLEFAEKSGNEECVRYLKAVKLFKIAKHGGNDFEISQIITDPNVNVNCQNYNGDIALGIALEFANINLVQQLLFNRNDVDITIENNDSETLFDIVEAKVLNDKINDSDKGMYEQCLQYMLDKVKSILLDIDKTWNLQKLDKYLLVLRRLKSEQAKISKANFYFYLTDISIKFRYLTLANVSYENLLDCNDKNILLHRRDQLIYSCFQLQIDEIENLIAAGVNPNVLLNSDNINVPAQTPLTHAVIMNRPDIISALMKSPVIDPHMPNEFGEIPAYLAFKQEKVACYAAIVMETKTLTPICNNSDDFDQLTITFPGMSSPLTVDTNNNNQVEMWQATALVDCWNKGKSFDSPASQLDWVVLRKDLREQFFDLQDNYAATHALSKLQMNEFSTTPEEAFFLCRHRTVGFLYDPKKRGEYESQSAVMSIVGYPTSAFSHDVSSVIGAPICYKGNFNNIIAGAKGDLNSVKLYEDYPRSFNGKELEYERLHGWERLGLFPKIQGNTIVRNRFGNAYKIRDGYSLKAKIIETYNRLNAPYYLSKKKFKNSSGDELIQPRIKAFEQYWYWRKFGTIPYNEVLIKTAAAEENNKNPVSDISHIFITEHIRGGMLIGSLLAALSTQIELILHDESKQFFPICFYNASSGQHTKISISSLALLTKLAELTNIMPDDCVDFNYKLADAIAPMTFEEFFTNEYSCSDIQNILQKIVPFKYHNHPDFIYVLETGKEISPQHKEFSIYLPYISKNYNEILLQSHQQNINSIESWCKYIQIDLYNKLYGHSKNSWSVPIYWEITQKLKSILEQLYNAAFGGYIYKSTIPSSEGNTVVKYIPDVSSWKFFWKSNSNALDTAYLWNLLAIKLINCPYEDSPDDMDPIKTVEHTGIETATRLYRSNHDVSHAARKRVGVMNLVAMINIEGHHDIQKTMQQFSSEELALLELVAFLQRCGRTNEKPGSEDPSNEERSMEIIKLVAVDLGFDPKLVNSVISNAVNCYSSNNFKSEGFSGSYNMRTRKAKLFYRLLIISHNSDLGRCRSNGKDCILDLLNDNNCDSLLRWMVGTNKLERIANQLVNFSLMMSELTGTEVWDYKIDFSNLELKKKSLENVAEIMDSMLEKAPFMMRLKISSRGLSH